MRRRREKKGRVVGRVCVFAPLGGWSWIAGLEGGAEMMLGTRTESSWKRLRFARSRRENGVGDNSPERTGRMKRGQS
jgi:hypothetical protein